jgi:expansin (peptidoglycan-binding protein)
MKKINSKNSSRLFILLSIIFFQVAFFQFCSSAEDRQQKALSARSPVAAVNAFYPNVDQEIAKLFRKNKKQIRYKRKAVSRSLMNGVATYYELGGGMGNCSFRNRVPGIYDVAINSSQYLGSKLCGAFVDIWGPGGYIRGRVADNCPSCDGPGHLDVNGYDAMRKITNGPGKVPIQWTLVKYVPGTAKIRVKEGSSQYWAAFMAYDISIPVIGIIAKNNNTNRWQILRREPYNYFIADAGLGQGETEIVVVGYDRQYIRKKIPQVTSEMIVDLGRNF